MPTCTFLIELDTRPDGIVNSSINSYSTEAITRATFFQRCAVATTSTQFTHVFLQMIDDNGAVYEQRYIVTQYQPEPEPEPEPEGNGEGE